MFVFAAAGTGALDGQELLAHRIATSLTAGAGMLALALVLVLAPIVRPQPLVRVPVPSITP